MTKKAKPAADNVNTVVVREEVAPPTLKKIGGSDRDAFNMHLSHQVLQSMWLAHSKGNEERDKAFQAALSAMMGIAPRDELEGMLASQMFAAHACAMECYRRGMIENQTFEGRNQNIAFATKASRTFAQLLETLDRHRGKGGQTVTVKHVNVYEGAQAIVGTVTQGGGEKATK
jgi:hypothetical protein